jgi:hypothetical protein
MIGTAPLIYPEFFTAIRACPERQARGQAAANDEVVRKCESNCAGRAALMVRSQIFDEEARLRSVEITAAARDAIEVNNGVIARA